MAAIPLGLSAYERTGLAPVSLKNLFYERAPTNTQDQTALIPRPRLKAFATLGEGAGDGPVRGLYRRGGVIFGRILALSGTVLFRVEQAGVPGAGTATAIGAVAGDGAMSAAGDAQRVVLTCGAGVYRTDGTTLDTVSLPDGVSCNGVDTLDGRFLFSINASNVFYWSGVGTTAVDALDYASAESQPDVLITLAVVDDIVWLLGRLSLEAWRPTGDADLPFERIEGRVFGIGCTARASVQKLNVGGTDSLCWVGADRRVYRLNPNPQRISDHGLEARLARSDPAALRSAAYSWNGHDFYILHIPGEGSFAFDMTTGLWDEIASHGRALFRGAVWASGPDNQPLLGDDASGTIFVMTDDQRGDDAPDHDPGGGRDPVLFEATGFIETGGPPLRCDTVRLECETGAAADTGDDPFVTLDTSDDHGATFRHRGREPLGRQGQRARRVIWTRLGLIRRPGGRLFRFRTTAPVVIRRARINEAHR